MFAAIAQSVLGERPVRSLPRPSKEVIAAFLEQFDATEAQAVTLLSWAFASRNVKRREEPQYIEFEYVEQYMWPFVMQRSALYQLGEAYPYLGIEYAKSERITNRAYAKAGKRFTDDVMAFIRKHAG